MTELPHSEKPRFLGPPVDVQGRLRKRKLPLGNAESLTAMSQDYSFFTPGPAFLYGLLSDGTLIDYVNEMGEDVPFFVYKFNKPVFEGLHTPNGDADWNHVLFAVPQEFWESFSGFMCSVVMSIRAQGTVIRWGLQELLVLDPLCVDKTVVLDANMKRLTIGAFCPYGNQYKSYFEPGEPEDTPPRFRLHPPDDAMEVFSKAHFAGRNPLNAKESFLRRKAQEAQSNEDPNGSST